MTKADDAAVIANLTQRKRGSAHDAAKAKSNVCNAPSLFGISFFSDRYTMPRKSVFSQKEIKRIEKFVNSPNEPMFQMD